MAYTSVERGIGDSGRRLQLSKANRNFTTQYFKSSHASGDVRIQYLHDRFTSTGGGDIIRGVAEAYATGCAAGATINAAHFTGRVGAATTIAGALNALRATLEIAGTAQTPGGTLSAIQLDSNAVVDTVLGAEDAYLRVTNSGSVGLKNLLNIEVAPAANSATALVATSANAVTLAELTDYIKIRVNGVNMWLVATTHTPHA